MFIIYVVSFIERYFRNFWDSVFYIKGKNKSNMLKILYRGAWLQFVGSKKYTLKTGIQFNQNTRYQLWYIRLHYDIAFAIAQPALVMQMQLYYRKKLGETCDNVQLLTVGVSSCLRCAGAACWKHCCGFLSPSRGFVQVHLLRVPRLICRSLASTSGTLQVFRSRCTDPPATPTTLAWFIFLEALTASHTVHCSHGDGLVISNLG